VGFCYDSGVKKWSTLHNSSDPSRRQTPSLLDYQPATPRVSVEVRIIAGGIGLLLAGWAAYICLKIFWDPYDDFLNLLPHAVFSAMLSVVCVLIILGVFSERKN
jgi:hypothetical protein